MFIVQNYFHWIDQCQNQMSVEVLSLNTKQETAIFSFQFETTKLMLGTYLVFSHRPI